MVAENFLLKGRLAETEQSVSAGWAVQTAYNYLIINRPTDNLASELVGKKVFSEPITIEESLIF